ncbi:unnamed protein product [Rodentolepis nana]|uniref:Condensation domain-containing protein n=1 Tax=Rodentolepis nana TaxID=102285 RepID=A0A0R3T6I6_RODNA|nr:unnamed protein product [Rodentolepis nana]
MCAPRLFDSSAHCNYSIDKAKWIRSLHFNNKSFSLNIEVNDRPSNWIVNYIFEILLRERFGYRNINFIYAPWDSSANAIDRLNCKKSKRDCSRPPPIHVNLEVWLRTGEQVSDYAPLHLVRNNGPLGPITRWGLYANEDLWNQYSPLYSTLRGFNGAVTFRICLSHWMFDRLGVVVFQLIIEEAYKPCVAVDLLMTSTNLYLVDEVKISNQTISNGHRD